MLMILYFKAPEKSGKALITSDDMYGVFSLKTIP